MMPSISELARFGQSQGMHSVGMRMNGSSVFQSRSVLSPKGTLTNTKLFGLSENMVPALTQRSAFAPPPPESYL